jgi:hypothetical protein
LRLTDDLEKRGGIAPFFMSAGFDHWPGRWQVQKIALPFADAAPIMLEIA